MKRPPNLIETLPNGIEVAYWATVGVDGKPQERRYAIGGADGEQVPSVSTIAGVFDKPALVPAAVKIQEQGIIKLAASGVGVGALTQPELRAKLRERGLDYNSVWAEARGRGTASHDILCELTQGKQVNIFDYDPDSQPWLRGAHKFTEEQQPQVEHAEYVVASTKYGYAGRGDLFCVLRDGRRARIDYKTVTEWKERKGKRLPPYDENLIALAGYEIAAVESGYPPSDVQIIVRLGPDGGYDMYESKAKPSIFLAALTAYREKRELAVAI